MKYIYHIFIILLIFVFTSLNKVDAGHFLFPPVPTKPPKPPRPVRPTSSPAGPPEKNDDNYGTPVNGDRPKWVERSAHLLTNILRIDPQGYKKMFFTGGETISNVLSKGGIYQPMHPLYYRRDLDKSALFHSEDMSSTPCFQHSSCNGTDTDTRLRYFYSGCGDPNQDDSSYGENIIKGMKTAKDSINYWICEKWPIGNGDCVSDGYNDGHRSNLLNSDFYSIGMASKLSNVDSLIYWTQDFDSSICPMDIADLPIHSGSHIFSDDKSSCTFGVTFYSDKKSITSVIGKVYINYNTPTTEEPFVFDLTLKIGSTTKGVYFYDTSNFSKNDSYYFEFTILDNSKSITYRYPQKGYLRLIDESILDEPSWVKV
ncbi:hypothetical protein ACTFIZ_010012 [Dictyostelium cf. discoideum]